MSSVIYLPLNKEVNKMNSEQRGNMEAMKD